MLKTVENANNPNIEVKMIQALANTKLVTLSAVPIVSFEWSICLPVLIALLGLSLLLSLMYLFVLQKYKIIRGIQNKE